MQVAIALALQPSLAGVFGQVLRIGRIMGRFLSTYPGRFDAKGRLSIPAVFRAVLEADGHPGLIVHPALEVPALECGGNRLLQEIEALIARFPAYSEGRDLMATALLGASEVLKFDTEGRVFLPEAVRMKAGLGSNVMFVGLGEKFRIWAPEQFSVHLDEAKSRLRQVRAELSSGSGPMRGVQET